MRLRFRTEQARERGYVMPMTALLLVPLMIFAALATDVGAWYIRADQIQRASDAAALAGTVWVPDMTKATSVARDVAARNGFRDPAWTAVHGGTANASVTVPGLTNSGGLIVDIKTTSPSYFGAVVLDHVSIERRSVAAVTKPVRLGNPSNGLGTGNLSSTELGITPDGIWLSLNGWCQDHQQGDPFSVGFYGAQSAGGNYWDACNSSNLGTNPTLNPNGYTYVVDVPPNAGQIDLQVFEPGLCTDANGADSFYSAEDNYANGPRLNMRVFANDDTELYADDNLADTPVFDHLYAKTDCTGSGNGAGGRWYTMYSIPAGAAHEGRWYIQANVRQNVQEFELNSFALRAMPHADTQLCTSMTSATCPELYALDWMSLYRPTFGGSGFSGTPSLFFLASVPDEHAGKTFEITMFDPGEGMNNVQFLNPAGTAASFTWQKANCSVGKLCSNTSVWPETGPAANNTCSGNPCLDVTNAKFQDQFIIIKIQLPANYSCGSNCWWTVRYTPTSNATVTDRTTWSAKVIGGPVHLIE